jgi:hypothetical protein
VPACTEPSPGNGQALTRDPTPSTQLDWYPEALVDEAALVAARRRQANAVAMLTIVGVLTAARRPRRS